LYQRLNASKPFRKWQVGKEMILLQEGSMKKAAAPLGGWLITQKLHCYLYN
jgi:hypothetical protein